MFRLGNIILMIFRRHFSFYTNNFFDQTTKKNLDFYNVLGLGKREIALVVFWELFYSCLISLAAGASWRSFVCTIGVLDFKKRFLEVGRIFRLLNFL